MIARPLLIAWVLVAWAGGAMAESAVTGEVRQLVATGQYGPALQRIAQALSLKGSAAAEVNRFELFMLKGECHLCTRQVNLATEAFDKAGQAATTDDQRGVAAAYGLMMKRSQQLAYRPKAGSAPGKPAAAIDLVEPPSRKRAMAALWADELAVAEPKVKAAAKATALPALMDGIKLAGALSGLERAATGDAAKSREMFKALGDQARKLLAATIADANKRVAAIDREASTFVEHWYEALVPTRFSAKPIRKLGWKRKGPTEAQLDELQALAAQCDKVGPAVESLTAGLRADPKDFGAFADDAARTRKEIARVLEVDYLHVFETPPK